MILPRFQATERDPLWRREMRERWRRPVTLFFLVLYGVGLCWLAYSLYASLVPAGTVELGLQSRGIGHQLFVSLLGAQIAGWIPIAVLLAAPSLSIERERNSFTEYLLAGLSPRQIVRAKFASIATFIIVMCAIPIPILALCFPLGGVDPLELVAGALFEMAVALTCASIGLLISANNTRVVTAMQHGLTVAAVLLVFGTPFLLGSLGAPPLLWLLIAAFLLPLISQMLGACEEVLDESARHLERYEAICHREYLLTPSPQIQPRAPAVRAARACASNANPAKRTSIDVWIEKVASRNAVTQREVRAGLRQSRLHFGLALDEPTEHLPLWMWIAIGTCGAIIVRASGISMLWGLGIGATTIGTIISAALCSSSAFTREREQKMLTQLQLSALSPLEIMIGKIAVTLLLVARSWGGPMLAFCIAGVARGAGVALASAVFTLLSVLLTATMGTTLSLLCRYTSISVGGTLGVLALLFFIIPLSWVGLTFFAPSLKFILMSPHLRELWIEPMRVMLGVSSSLSPARAVLHLAAPLIAINALLIATATVILAHTRLDDAATGPRFWDRDLSRSWR